MPSRGDDGRRGRRSTCPLEAPRARCDRLPPLASASSSCVIATTGSPCFPGLAASRRWPGMRSRTSRRRSPRGDRGTRRGGARLLRHRIEDRAFTRAPAARRRGRAARRAARRRPGDRPGSPSRRRGGRRPSRASARTRSRGGRGHEPARRSRDRCRPSRRGRRAWPSAARDSLPRAMKHACRLLLRPAMGGSTSALPTLRRPGRIARCAPGASRVSEAHEDRREADLPRGFPAARRSTRTREARADRSRDERRATSQEPFALTLRQARGKERTGSAAIGPVRVRDGRDERVSRSSPPPISSEGVPPSARSLARHTDARCLDRLDPE